MTLNFWKVRNGISLATQSSAPASPANGDIYYDSTLLVFRFYQNGSWTTLGGSASTSGTRGSPNSISAGGSIAVVNARRQVIFVQGNSAPVSLSASAPFTSLTNLSVGDEVVLIGRSDTNTVTLLNVSGNAEINGDCTLGASDTITLIYDGTALVEGARS